MRYIVLASLFFTPQISLSKKITDNSSKSETTLSATKKNEVAERLGAVYIPDQGYRLYSLKAGNFSETTIFIKPIFSTNEVSRIFSEAFSDETINQYIGEKVSFICNCTGFLYKQNSLDYFEIHTASIEIVDVDSGIILQRFQ
ncbi:hypothetical protein [Massilia sp. YIM B04103]|uniref:hypothetical protein n=1 Tax=Massilia sp. YIM B04103 TaxID=2963106 RepID=UPI00210D0E4D|nr:hypothetical protein [Massilia sp. YIM B04103]